MWRVLLTASLVFASSVPAAAAEWWWISASGNRPDRQLVFMDKSSATTDYANHPTYWAFRIYESLQEKGVRKRKELYKFDCRERTYTIIEALEYGNNDKFINSIKWESYEQSATNVAPDTVGESELNFACFGKAPVTTPLTTSPEQFSAYFFKLSD